MIRVSAGHYRDSFARAVYEVKRYSLPLGTKTEKKWEFTIPKFGVTKMGFGTKEEAARQARVAVLDWMDAETSRQWAFEEANQRHPLPISGTK